MENIIGRAPADMKVIALEALAVEPATDRPADSGSVTAQIAADIRPGECAGRRLDTAGLKQLLNRQLSGTGRAQDRPVGLQYTGQQAPEDTAQTVQLIGSQAYSYSSSFKNFAHLFKTVSFSFR